MKIFVSYPDGNNAESNKVFKEAVSYLKKQGHSVKEDLEFRKKPNAENNLLNKIERAIKDTDIVLVELDGADSKVGFDISKALNEKKVVIALEKEKGGKAPGFISSLNGNSKTLIIKKYNDKNLHEILDTSIEEAKSKLDTKFILIISPEIDRYLDWAAGTKRMHKAQIVRNSIEAAIKKDREYKAYLD